MMNILRRLIARCVRRHSRTQRTEQEEILYRKQQMMDYVAVAKAQAQARTGGHPERRD